MRTSTRQKAYTFSVAHRDLKKLRWDLQRKIAILLRHPLGAEEMLKMMVLRLKYSR